MRACGEARDAGIGVSFGSGMAVESVEAVGGTMEVV
jgi:hypothetical protein